MKIDKPKIVLSLSAIALIIFGVIYLWYVWDKSLASTSEQALQKAKVSAIGLDGEMLKRLKGVSEDIGTVPYESLKKRLIELKKNSANVEFVYFYTQRDGKLYFMVDSEPEGSEDLAPAGMEYAITGTEYAKPFIDGIAIITKPATDEWGTWISALVPIKDPETGKVLEVFAMDYPANVWSKEAFFNSIQAGVIVFILFLLLLSFYWIIKNNFKLKKSEESYRLLVENSRDIIFTISVDGIFTFVSNSWTKILGNPTKEVIGKNIAEFIHPDDIQRCMAFIQSAFKKAKLQESIEYRVKHIDGSWRWHSSGGEPLFNDNKEIVGFYGVARDITKEKKILEETIQLNKYMVGRELKMVELKRQISELEKNKK